MRAGTARQSRNFGQRQQIWHSDILKKVARLTGLEPATPGVTGRYSNQLSYNRAMNVIYASRKGASIVKFRHAPTIFVFLNAKESGAVDGARTRDPRRDRPVL